MRYSHTVHLKVRAFLTPDGRPVGRSPEGVVCVGAYCVCVCAFKAAPAPCVCVMATASWAEWPCHWRDHDYHLQLSSSSTGSNGITERRAQP